MSDGNYSAKTTGFRIRGRIPTNPAAVAENPPPLSPPSLANKTPASSEAQTGNDHTRKPLPLKFRFGGFNYRQIAREGAVAIYEQSRKERVVAYEVIRIRRHNGFSIHGKFVEPAEYYPRPEEWGKWALTLPDRGSAFAKFQEIIRRCDGTKEPVSAT